MASIEGALLTPESGHDVRGWLAAREGGSTLGPGRAGWGRSGGAAGAGELADGFPVSLRGGWAPGFVPLEVCIILAGDVVRSLAAGARWEREGLSAKHLRTMKNVMAHPDREARTKYVCTMHVYRLEDDAPEERETKYKIPPQSGILSIVRWQRPPTPAPPPIRAANGSRRKKTCSGPARTEKFLEAR